MNRGPNARTSASSRPSVDISAEERTPDAPAARFTGRTEPDVAAATTSKDRTTRLVAVIPAHNEQDSIAATITSLRGQTRPPDRIVVMADNCTDDTVTIARLAGAEVVSTVDNSAKKAGALNQGLDLVLPTLTDHDLLLAMDADSQLVPEFIANANRLFATRDELGGLSGSIVARPHDNLVELAQAIEYARGTRQTGRKGGRVHVLSGAATIMRVRVLREVAASRGTRLPGETGQVFMEDSLTEDYEVTLAIRQLGYLCISTKHCKVVTDVMPTLEDLKIQRVRWYRGAMESLSLYGWTPLTHKTWVLLGITYLSSMLVPLVITLLAMSFLLFDADFDARWLAIWPVMMAEQYLHARRVDIPLWRMPLLFFPLWAYDIVLFYHCWVALNQLAKQTTRTWTTGLVNRKA